MSLTVERYVIKHVSGSKINQVEEFDFSKKEITIGRVAGSDIQYDPESETIVSREHAKIVKAIDGSLKFTITDNNSRNGIFVNKVRVKGSMPLEPGDTVQLGNNGPSFTFDIYPRPQDMMMATRVVEIPASIKATTISEIKPVNADMSASSEPRKIGLGKQTVERMLVTERKKNYGTMAVVIGGVIVLLGGLGFGFRDSLFKKETVVINNAPPVDSSQLNRKLPDQISAENNDKVIQIEFGWSLFDSRTNDELWHEYSAVKDANNNVSYMALYVQNENGNIEPLLKLKRDAVEGIPVGITGATGSGFVVSEDGYILTNRHVAAGWNTSWSFPNSAFPGLLVKIKDGKEVIDYESRVNSENLGTWVPANATMIAGKAVAPGTIRGENTYMNVVFSGTTERRMARLVQPSDEHDVALIKVDIPSPLAKVKMKDDAASVTPGQSITVMGYPGVSPQAVSVRGSNDPFNPDYKTATRPTPTVTPGSIGRIIPASSMKEMKFSGFGDSYQLTVTATGAGNSGGPLFDHDGNVIGIYYASAQDDQGTRITFAVPIKYGLQLMGIGKTSGL
jgi:S1-C subfamily serine protease/pSer/pThr/pTyr-binding forkhead associated (FHA) protein